MSALTKVYEELALERAHVCTGCGATYQLSHSHIIPRSQDKSLEAIKDNITFHCFSCHAIWEHRPMRVFMKDFHANMVYAYKANQTFYWLRIFKMHQYWQVELDFPEKSQDRLKLAVNAMAILNKLSLATQAIHMGMGINKIEN